MKTVWVNGQKITPKAADLIQSGGEGMVFAWKPSHVIKLYHAANSQHQAKLQAMIDRQISDSLPDHVFAPQQLVTDKNGAVVGFTMGRLPSGYQPFKRLSNPNYAKKQQLDLPQMVAYLQTLQRTLSTLHQKGLVLGDLNDQNIFFDPKRPGEIAFIDVDSYQFDRFPCPVAMQPFLDPNLYTVPDFSLKPYFSPASDWYAFCVLMVRTLLFTHPYGGVHPIFKSLAQRAENRVSVFSTEVKYPPKARAHTALSPALQDFVGRVFEQGERPIVSPSLLENYLHYLQNRQTTHQALPTIQRQTAAHAPTNQHKTLLQTTGDILAVWPQTYSGRYHALTYENGLFQLTYAGVGGVIYERPLFNGTPDYRFGLFGQYLIINPPQRKQLLILDIEADPPQRIAMLESDIFRHGAEEAAVFATTPNYYYRLLNGYLMRGKITGGAAVDEISGTAYQHQTQLWGSTHNDTFIALHRSFGEYTLFAQLHTGKTVEQPLLLPAKASLKQVDSAFSPDSGSLLLQMVNSGREQSYLLPLGSSKPIKLPFLAETHVNLPSGFYFPTEMGLVKWKNGVQTILPNTADWVTFGDTIHPHRNGVLVQKPQQLDLIQF